MNDKGYQIIGRAQKPRSLCCSSAATYAPQLDGYGKHAHHHITSLHSYNIEQNAPICTFTINKQ